MKPKAARRFLSRNQWRLAAGGITTPSFFRRVDEAREVLKLEKYKRLEPMERIWRMFNKF